MGEYFNERMMPTNFKMMKPKIAFDMERKSDFIHSQEATVSEESNYATRAGDESQPDDDNPNLRPGSEGTGVPDRRNPRKKRGKRSANSGGS